MTDKIIDVETQAVARQDRSSVLLMPVMDVPTALARLTEFQAFCAQYLQESTDGGQDGGDYGVIPGTKKKTLLKSGAEKLCEIYGLADTYEVMTRVENWETGLFDYTLTCTLRSRRDDSLVGTGVGSCSTFESKYRWRDQQKTCPQCGIAAIIKGKDFTNRDRPAGWLCWNKKGGCGAKFVDGDPAIEGQPVGRVENPDIIDAKNTALKMAKKRAKIDAVIGVTRSSGIFTQDLEDVAQATPVKADSPKATPAPVRAPERQPEARNGHSASAPVDPPNPAFTGGEVRTHPSAPNGEGSGILDTELPPPSVIGEAQGRRLYAISKAAGWSVEELKDWLFREHALLSIKAIPKADYTAICAAVEKGPAPAMVPVDEVF